MPSWQSALTHQALGSSGVLRPHHAPSSAAVTGKIYELHTLNYYFGIIILNALVAPLTSVKILTIYSHHSINIIGQ